MSKLSDALHRIFTTPRALGIQAENDSEFWKIATEWTNDLSRQWTDYHQNIFSKYSIMPSLENRIRMFVEPSIERIRVQNPEWLIGPSYFYWMVLFRAIIAANTDSEPKVREALLKIIDVDTE